MKWNYLIALLLIPVVLSGCTPKVSAPPPSPPTTPTPVAPSLSPQPTPVPIPTPAPTPNTTPPSTITGLGASDAYDGRVNLRWDMSTSEDFSHYNIYASKSEIVDVTGMIPIHQIANIAINTYQVTGLEKGTKYYFAVAAVDKSGNENTLVASVRATPTPMPRGTSDPDIHVDVYHSDSVWSGTTLLPDNHNSGRPRVIEVNMLGEIVWEYQLPQDLKGYTNPGFDVEWLPNNNILLLLPLKGVYEVNRSGDIVWSYLDKKVSHDADRLPNGNTLVVFGGEDVADDAQVKEINTKGEIVWAWYAKDHFYKSPYKDIYDGGWTHTNAVLRLPNGNTLISPRNFNFVVEVDSQGSVVRTIGEGIFHRQHDPEVLPNGNILVANHIRPQRAMEVNPQTGEIVWQSVEFERDASPIRDADRLPNGNTLITGTTKIVEVTPEGKIVWQLSLKGVLLGEQDLRGVGFYKAERIDIPR